MFIASFTVLFQMNNYNGQDQDQNSKLCIGNLNFMYGITEFVTKTVIGTCVLHALYYTQRMHACEEFAVRS